MRNCLVKLMLWIMALSLGLALMGCGSSNRLKDYTFRDMTAAALIAVPSEPEVFTDSFLDIDPEDLLASALRAGTTLAKEITADQTRARLDSAMAQVDLPEQILDGTLQRCSQYLHLLPIYDPDRSDFLFDMVINSYGIDAESWDSRVYFKMDLEVYLLDNNTGLEIWKTRVKEKQPVSGLAFGTSSVAADNIITAVGLSQLSVEEMVEGFQYLADDTADRVARKLRRDYAKSRESE